MRYKKIRGQTRRQKAIAHWRQAAMSFDLVNDVLGNWDRYYVKIRIHPWSGLSMVNSSVPEPQGKVKQHMLNGLLDIYEHWKIQLDKTGKPYYLKIWLNEQRFTKSQVVCAVGNALHFYDHTFSFADKQQPFQPDGYGKTGKRLTNYTWEHRLDEDIYTDNEIGLPEEYASIQDFEETRIWFRRLLKKPHRKEKLESPIDGVTEFYAFNRGDVFIGELK
jgi:hypothetical protein